jgi:hypothetical protein
VIGDQYYEIEKLVIGKHGFTYFIVGCSVAGFMGLLILISIICCIVKCCRSQSKVDDVMVIAHSKLESDSRLGTTRNPGKYTLEVFLTLYYSRHFQYRSSHTWFQQQCEPQRHHHDDERSIIHRLSQAACHSKVQQR